MVKACQNSGQAKNITFHLLPLLPMQHARHQDSLPPGSLSLPQPALLEEELCPGVGSESSSRSNVRRPVVEHLASQTKVIAGGSLLHLGLLALQAEEESLLGFF